MFRQEHVDLAALYYEDLSPRHLSGGCLQLVQGGKSCCGNSGSAPGQSFILDSWFCATCGRVSAYLYFTGKQKPGQPEAVFTGYLMAVYAIPSIWGRAYTGIGHKK